MSTPTTRRYRVLRKVDESQTIASVTLTPVDGPCPPFEPGDYLVVSHPDGTLKREYSISQGSAEGLRISVKREPAPQGTDHAPGQMSGFIHDTLAEGDEIDAYGPLGKFHLEQASNRPVVLLGGGVGQTPLIAMAHQLATEGRACLYVHACEHGGVHAHHGEVSALAEQHRNLKMLTVYAAPRPQDTAHDASGFVTQPLLAPHLPDGETEFYLCGPAPFMTAMYDMLCEMGVEDDRIHYEFFGPATLMKRPSAPAGASSAAGTGPMISFAASGIEQPWDDSIDNLLEFAEEHGIYPDYSCRAGSCDTCKTRLISGEVDYATPPMETPEEGYALICCARPKGPVKLDL